jgi:hypothetical protein
VKLPSDITATNWAHNGWLNCEIFRLENFVFDLKTFCSANFTEIRILKFYDNSTLHNDVDDDVK